jgi:gentisate 1,2-dioxygenase
MNDLVMSDSAARAALAQELDAMNCRVAQPGDPPVFTKTPSSAMRPCHWRAIDLARMFERIGANLKLEAGGQRRTLRLTNAGLPYGTTPTFWASLQVILPGEVATAHRHAANALRFIMQGDGADTIVEGEHYQFSQGDLVLTPSGAWHDHEHKGLAPMIWLDVLDISLVRALHATFFEPSDIPRRPVAAIPDHSLRAYGSGLLRPRVSTHQGLASPLLVYSRAHAEEAVLQASLLEPDPFDDTAMEYQNPLTGGPALPTLGTVLQFLRPSFRGEPHRHTGSAVYYIIRGSGSTQVDDQRFDWGPGDFLALPPWSLHSHINRSASDHALMFQVNDLPTLEKLGLYREEVP